MKTLDFTIASNSSMWNDHFLGGNTFYSNAGAFYFMVLINGPKNGVLRPTANSLYACREDVAHYDVRQRVARYEERAKTWFNRTRVVVYVPNHTAALVNRWMEYGLKHMHILEKKVGWPLSKLWRLENKEFADDVNCYYFEGTKKWVHSPQMMSFYLLLMRCGRYVAASRAKEVAKLKTIKALKKHWSAKVGEDAKRMRSVLENTDKILKNYSKLFGKRPMKSMWRPKQTTSSWLHNEGIHKMLSCYTADKVLEETWNKVK